MGSLVEIRGFFAFGTVDGINYICCVAATIKENIDLFEYLTTNSNWWKGYCSEVNSRSILHRHREGKLTEATYEKIFTFHGFKKTVTWTREIKQS